MTYLKLNNIGSSQYFENYIDLLLELLNETREYSNLMSAELNDIAIFLLNTDWESHRIDEIKEKHDKIEKTLKKIEEYYQAENN